MAQARLPRLDTLRALAVILVVLFHLDVAYFDLGYLGVDLFFLLSGFLMTYTMVLDQRAHSIFRVGAFFVRRFVRIVPSLLITIAVVGLIATVLMSPEHLHAVAKQGLYAELFVSNFYFFNQAGYFAPGNELRPLLHTWSLSVEEQFYLFFGLLLWAGNVVRFGVVIACASVLAAIVTVVGLAVTSGFVSFGVFKDVSKLPDAIFYLLPFRMVQFLFGCALALLFVSKLSTWQARQRGHLARAVHVTAIGLPIAGALALTLVEDLRPVSILLVPLCFAPALLHAPLLDRLGAVMSVRFIARISYQIYLTHWPMVVFYKYWTFDDLSTFAVVGLFALSVVTGWLLYRASIYLTSKGALSLRTVGLLGTVLAASTALQVVSKITDGMSWRIPSDRLVDGAASQRARESRYCGGTHLSADKQELGGRPGDPLITCTRRGATDKTIYILGDSHARHLLPGLSETYPKSTLSVMYFTSCLAQSGIGAYRYDFEGRKALADACVTRNQKAVTFFENLPPSTIFIHQYAGYAGDNSEVWYKAAANLVTTLEKPGHTVLWIGSVPYPNKYLADCIAVPWIYSATRLKRRCTGDYDVTRRVFEKNKRLAERFGTRFLNVNAFFCTGAVPETCSHMVEGAPAFRDKHHLTVASSIALMRWVKKQLDANSREAGGSTTTK